MKSFCNSIANRIEYLIALYILMFSLTCFADRIRYCASIDIYDTSGEYIAHHYHNWSIGKEDGKLELSKNGEQLFFKEVSAFSYIKIFEKYKCIVLLSKIRINNLDQIEIIGFDRKVLLKKTITMNSVINSREYGISESVTNYIFWYNEKDPDLRIIQCDDSYKIQIKTPNNNFLSYTLPADSVEELLSDPSKPLRLKKVEWGSNNQRKRILKGLRSEPSIMKMISQNSAHLRNIHSKRLVERPGLEGLIKLRVRILSSGDVIYCKVIESTLIDDIILNEIVSYISSWKFGELKQPNDTTEIVLPFAFSE